MVDRRGGEAGMVAAEAKDSEEVEDEKSGNRYPEEESSVQELKGFVRKGGNRHALTCP